MAMKLHFEPDLDYQQEAINAVCDLFKGQEVCHTEFTVARQVGDGQLFNPDAAIGIGNRRGLLDEQIAANLQDVQLRNGLAPHAGSLQSRDFTVEMETGTGKTYVYLRTIYELHQRYGFTKYVIVVPSTAIVEGVMKTIEMTRDHFHALYSGTPANAFRYDSQRISQLRDFATSSTIQILVTTIQSVNRADNVINKPHEDVGGGVPMDLLRGSRPIVIVDEPQSVEGGEDGAGRQAIVNMHPLCTVGYSATPKTPYPRVYRLDAVDAYERELVKQIEVASGIVSGGAAGPYVKFVGLGKERGAPAFTKPIVELDVATDAGGVRRSRRMLDLTRGRLADLAQVAGRPAYGGVIAKSVDSVSGAEPALTLALPGSEVVLALGDAIGQVDAAQIHKQQIRKTLEEHFEKELRLNPQGIKVLSLFFIDHVSDYRLEDGSPGPLAEVFEQQYREVASQPRFQTLFGSVDANASFADVHGGYFSQDKRTGAFVDTRESNQEGREAAREAYALIMRDKERLLSLGTPLRFIFSHSALREGWDNPNVFQICSLRDMASEQQRRQTVGRGLRICVDQSGSRVRGFDVNTVTVIATESYSDFAENLQKEMAADGMQFGLVESHVFARLLTDPDDDASPRIGLVGSEEIWKDFMKRGYLTGDGYATPALREALDQGSLELPPTYESAVADVAALLEKLISRRVKVKDARERVVVGLNEHVIKSTPFLELWERIKARSTYRVHFDADALAAACADGIRAMEPVPPATIQWTKARVSVGAGGIEATQSGAGGAIALADASPYVPDILTELQERTHLKRRTIAAILGASGRLPDFVTNPPHFIDQCAAVINREKKKAIVDGIAYVRSDPADDYAIELFRTKELNAYTDNVVDGSAASLYARVACDSGIEKAFAGDLALNSDVAAYVKLPGWFTIPTPLGDYNPDWALVVDGSSGQRIYFVVETKGTAMVQALRMEEQQKIACGRSHFDALAAERPGDSAAYIVETSLPSVLQRTV